MTKTTQQTATREQLEAENAHLRRLLAESGIDAQAQAIVRTTRDAEYRDDLGFSRVETVQARQETRLLQLAIGEADAQLRTSNRLIDDLRANQVLLHTVLNTVPVGILLAEVPSGRIVMGNSRVEEILGHPPIYSTNISSYDAYVAFHADGRQVAAGEWPLARVVNGEESAELEARYLRPDGNHVWIAVHGEAVKADGVTIGAVIAFRSIEDRKKADAAQDTINHELAHRLKNTLAIVQSIATSTLREVSERPLVEAFERRVLALSRAHDVLMQKSWAAAQLKDVMKSVLTMQVDLDRFTFDGPDMDISPQATLSLSMLLHEMATNALKYGALSAAVGRVRIAWRTEEGEAPALVIDWREYGGPPVTPPSDRPGFGSRLIRMGLVGTRAVTLCYEPVGLHAEFRAPLADMQAQIS